MSGVPQEQSQRPAERKFCCGYHREDTGKAVHAFNCPRYLVENYVSLEHEGKTVYMSQYCEDFYKLHFKCKPSAESVLKMRKSIDDLFLEC